MFSASVDNLKKDNVSCANSQYFDSVKYCLFKLSTEALENALKFVFKAFYSDQAFLDFLDTCSTFSAVCKKKIG